MDNFPILYKLTVNNQIQQWQIVVENNTFYTIEGIKEGKLTKSLPTICHPKNIGKSNELTANQQAYVEALAKYKKKVESGYSETLLKEHKFFIPMLAHNLDIDTLDYGIGVYIQPKLDGIRAISKDNKLTSRNGKEFLSCPHLLQNEVIIDGELYSHEYSQDFNQIISLVKRTKILAHHLEETKKKIKHYVYDFPIVQDVFSKRYKELQKWLNTFNKKEFIELVPTFKIENKQDLLTFHEQFIEKGYEGSIIRLDKGPYEHKRSKQLLKHKEWKDYEYTILDVIEGIGNRAGTVGKFLLKLDDNNTFESNIKGEFSYLRQLLKEKESIIGKKATVKFFNLTPAGVPRFPYVIKIDRDNYE